MATAAPPQRKTRLKTPFRYTAAAAKGLAEMERRKALFEKGPIDLPAFSTETEALNQYKKNQQGSLRIRKNKETGEAARIELTNRGNFERLFMNPSGRKWSQLGPAQQERLFEHYVLTTTRFLMGAQQNGGAHGTRRMTLAEAQKERLPFLERALARFRSQIRAKNEQLRKAQITLHAPTTGRTFTRGEVNTLENHIAGLERRATVAEGVVELLKDADPYSERMERAELGRKRAEALRKRQPEFTLKAGRKLLAAHTGLRKMETGRLDAEATARERIWELNKEFTLGMKTTDPAYEQMEKMRKNRNNPARELIPEFNPRYRRTLHQIKSERRGLIRVQKNKETGKVEKVLFTSRGKFLQLFQNTAKRPWEETNSEQQERIIQYYVSNATKFLTSTNQRIGKQFRRLKLPEAREARIPLLKQALQDLQHKIEENRETIQFAEQNHTGESEYRKYGPAEIRTLWEERTGLQNRATVLQGVIDRLSNRDYSPEIMLRIENRGKKRRKKSDSPQTETKPEKRRRAHGQIKEPKTHNPYHPYWRNKQRTALVVRPEKPETPLIPARPRETPRAVPQQQPTREPRGGESAESKRETPAQPGMPEQPESVRRARTENELRLARIEQKRTKEKRFARFGLNGRLKRRVRVHWKILRGKTRYARDLRRKGFNRFNPFRNRKKDETK